MHHDVCPVLLYSDEVKVETQEGYDEKYLSKYVDILVMLAGYISQNDLGTFEVLGLRKAILGS